MVRYNSKKAAIKHYRPKIEIPRTQMEVIGEIVALLGLIVLVVIFFTYWGNIPDSVPMNFDASGKPNEWGSKLSLQYFLLIPLALYILLTLIGRKPHLFNFSVKINKQNAEKLYSIAIKYILFMKAILAWMFVYIFYAIFQVSLGLSDRMGWGAWVFLIAIFVSLAVFFIVSYKNR
ncbi:MAG: DUF1648 domain-containing protein [Bacillota bacterium]|jgi:uncharacterized membrane protein